MFTNWKTTLTGLGAVMVAGGHLLTNVANGDFGSIAIDGPMILSGLGLLFAKDHNVTGV